MDQSVVKVGQVWADCDPRYKTRKIEVVSIEGDVAVVKSNSSKRLSKIKLARFKGSEKKGYRLVKDVAASTPQTLPQDHDAAHKSVGTEDASMK